LQSLAASVGGNTAVGELATQLLPGLIRAILILEFLPQASSALPYNADGGLNLNAAVYFSTATLTTLKNGDISPIGWLIQVAACLEGITGTPP
jgi:hypothetical protein